ncbi:MAG: PAS domain S-box protein, partial [Anaerolineae bacterium]|nr:PAS domain S-box protein [Anaerolineae bacterium]
MSLRRKTFLIVSLILIGLLLVFQLTLGPILNAGYQRHEDQHVQESARRARGVLDHELVTLGMMVADWGHRDDIYAFAADGNAAYVAANLDDARFVALHLDFMLFAGTDGQRFFGKLVNLATGAAEPLPEGLDTLTAPDGALLSRTLVEGQAAGLFVLAGRPLLVAATQILPSDGLGAPRGVLVWGRFLAGEEIARLSALAWLELELLQPADPAASTAFAELAAVLEASSLAAGEAPVLVQVLDDTTIAGYTLLTDLAGAPALVLRVALPRLILAQTQETMLFAMLALVLVSAVAIGVMLVTMDRLILKRISRLGQEVAAIGSRRDSAARVLVEGHDELGRLAWGINEMLAALQESEALYASLVEHLPLGVFRKDLQGRYTYANSRYCAFMARPLADVLGRTDFDQFPPEQAQFYRDNDLLVIEQNTAYDGIESGRYTTSDDTRYVRVVKTPVVGAAGRIVGVQGVIWDITEGKQAEEALRESETRYRALFNNTPYAILIVQGNAIVDCNPQAPAIFGCTREQFIGRRPQDFSPPFQPDGQPSAEKSDRQIKAALAGEVQQFEWLHCRLDGTPFDAEVMLNRLELGDDVFVQAILFDITQEKRTEAALTASEQTALAFQERLKALHEISIDLALVDTLDGLYRAAIELGTSRLGFDRLGMFLTDEAGEMVGTYGSDPQGEVRDISHQHNRPQADERFLRVLHSGDRVTVWQDVPLTEAWKPVGHGWNMLAAMWAGDRSIGWLAADNLLKQQPLMAYEPELLMLYGSTLGYLVTRKRVEQALRESEEKYRTLFDASSDAIFLNTLAGGILDCNEVACGMFGHAKDTLVGQSITDLLAPEVAASFPAAVATMQQGGRMMLELIGLRPDGATFPIEAVVRRVVVGDDVLVLVYARDVTERKQAEQQRIQLMLERERVRLLAEFIRNVSHEFRTPLSVMNSGLYLLSRLDDPVRRLAQVESLSRQVHYIGELIEAMLTLSRLDSLDRPSMTRQSLNSVVRSVETGLAGRVAEKNLTLVCDLAEDLPSVLGSGPDLHHALSELLINAIQYTPRGGTITLRTFRTAFQKVVVEVIDTGIGISEDDQERIFERFYRAD